MKLCFRLAELDNSDADFVGVFDDKKSTNSNVFSPEVEQSHGYAKALVYVYMLRYLYTSPNHDQDFL